MRFKSIGFLCIHPAALPRKGLATCVGEFFKILAILECQVAFCLYMALDQATDFFRKPKLAQIAGPHLLVPENAQTGHLVFVGQGAQMADIVQESSQNDLVIIAFSLSELSRLAGMFNLANGLTDVLLLASAKQEVENFLSCQFRAFSKRHSSWDTCSRPPKQHEHRCGLRFALQWLSNHSVVDCYAAQGLLGL